MRKDAKVVDSEPQEKPIETSATQTQKPASWNGGRIVWGMVLIVIGALLLLETLGAVSLNFAALWQLWPLLIITAGLSVLALRGWVSVVVSVIATVLIVGVAILALTGAVGTLPERQRNEVSVLQAQANVKAVDVRVKSGAVALDISAHDGDKLVVGTLVSNSLSLKKVVSMEGSVQKVELSTGGSGEWWRGTMQSDFAVQLTRKLPVMLRVDAGAANIRADLTQVNTRSVQVDSGASKIWLKLGSKQPISDVSVDTGASSVEILIPQATGVRLRLDSGLSSELLPDDLVKIGKDTYQSPDYDQQSNKINIAIDIGVSSFRLSRY